MSARKRRRIDEESLSSTCFAEIISELDLEIALRRRVAETIQSRITWALILQESLRRGGSGSTTSFKDAAFDALAAIEEPLDVIFAREVTPIVPPIQAQPARPPRPPPKQKVPRNPNAKFLYIRSSDLEPPYDENHVQTYLLRCPTCLRQTFTSLQGLFNHARITHRIEWGTHDDCVRACAVADPDLDVEFGNEVGLGPNGILPGLRSLFNMAVGAHQNRELLDGKEEDVNNATAGRVESPPVASNVTRTLGFHEDTPALAPFLGKETLRRGIKIWGDPNDIVDIDGFHNSVSGSSTQVQVSDRRRPWRMHFTHRNDFEPETERKMQEMNTMDSTLALQQSFTARNSPLASSEEPPTTTLTARKDHISIAGTRFHFSARISVMDRSFWIPPGMSVCFDFEALDHLLTPPCRKTSDIDPRIHPQMDDLSRCPFLRG
ncbi:hypothetical protein H0H87_012455 [Tephrocybe sp. NHM501043]|nr:hypothetical protein H0H87_012455 [Tephrocybe sp. NHM501043]